MALNEELKTKVESFLTGSWTERNGQVVPNSDSVAFKSEGVCLERATVFYSDLRGSTKLVESKYWWYAAEIYKSFLYCAGRIIEAKGGTITSYDGDRIMGVFVGKNQTTSAAKAALQLNYITTMIINPINEKKYGDQHFPLMHTTGIDTSKIHAVKTGVRADHDLVWIGRAANLAAKLTEVKSDKATWITKEAYDWMHDSVKKSEKGVSMWSKYNWTEFDDRTIYGSDWHWGNA